MYFILYFQNTFEKYFSITDNNLVVVSGVIIVVAIVVVFVIVGKLCLMFMKFKFCVSCEFRSVIRKLRLMLVNYRLLIFQK